MALTSTMATAAPKRLAVLEFQGDGIKIKNLQFITDAARSGVLQMAAQYNLQVYTRENQARFIQCFL